MNDWQRFFKVLFGDCEALIETRVLPGGVQEFWPAEFEDPSIFEKYLLVQSRQKNVYFGVATRDGTGGTKQNIVEIPAVWTDLDFKDTPPEQIKKNIASFSFRPSAAIHSGGGFHLYWALNEPATPAEINQVEDVNRRIAAALGGDLAAVDAARILRIPGTLNHKRGKRVVLRHLEDFRYNLDDFADLQGPESVEVPSSATHTKPAFELDHRRLVAVFACRFLRWAYENQSNVGEPLWYAAISNLARLSPGGIGLCHKFSEKHPGYKKSECDQKILHALDAAAPHSCAWIRSKGFKGCGNCRSSFPIKLIVRRIRDKGE